MFCCYLVELCWAARCHYIKGLGLGFIYLFIELFVSPCTISTTGCFSLKTKMINLKRQSNNLQTIEKNLQNQWIHQSGLIKWDKTHKDMKDICSTLISISNAQMLPPKYASSTLLSSLGLSSVSPAWTAEFLTFKMCNTAFVAILRLSQQHDWFKTFTLILNCLFTWLIQFYWFIIQFLCIQYN